MRARELTWIKSSFSETQEHSTCVEVALNPQVVAVRDSKAPAAGHLVIASRAWSAVLRALR